MFHHQMIGRKHFRFKWCFFKVRFLPCKTLWLWLCSKCWRHCHQKGENQNCIVHRIAYLQAMTNINILIIIVNLLFSERTTALLPRWIGSSACKWILPGMIVKTLRQDREYVIILHIAFFTFDQSSNNTPGGQSPRCLPVWNCCLLLSSGELHEKKCQASSSSSSSLSSQ